MFSSADKYYALLADLIREKAEFPGWESYYDRHIADLKAAIEEKFNGSGAGDSTGGSTELPDVSGGAPQVVRESGDANSTMSV